MGDLNLCFKKWIDAGYPHATLANEIKDFLISENCSTMVEDYTRMRQVDGSIQRSSLDQVISNCSSKMSRPEIIGVGKSDHLGVFITKYSKEVRTSPRTIKKRIYKHFSKDAFKEDIKKAVADGAFNRIDSTETIDEAIEIFNSVYCSILEEHAPVKIIQNRNNYVPYISKEIKQQMKERNEMKIKASKSGDPTDFTQYKSLRNQVVSKMKKAKLNY